MRVSPLVVLFFLVFTTTVVVVVSSTDTELSEDEAVVSLKEEKLITSNTTDSLHNFNSKTNDNLRCSQYSNVSKFTAGVKYSGGSTLTSPNGKYTATFQVGSGQLWLWW